MVNLTPVRIELEFILFDLLICFQITVLDVKDDCWS